jgi:hypothetical protein
LRSFGMAVWVPLVVAAAKKWQMAHVACSEWSLATHVRTAIQRPSMPSRTPLVLEFHTLSR